MRLVQLISGRSRRLAVVEEPHLVPLLGFDTTYALAWDSIRSGEPITTLVEKIRTNERLDYDAIYAGRSEWKLLPPIDHAFDPSRCIVSGTGLTHLGSAADRQAMHEKSETELTDSMKIFRWGLESGRPAPGEIGVAPEWFHKGNALMMRGPNDPLIVPAFSEDGGEEAEIAAACIIGPDGRPFRVGMAPGNEFSDHRFEKRNYLNLAGSKLRTFSLGPELTLDPDFQSVPGTVRIERGGKELWSRTIATGEKEMCHSLRNIEHHHFKFPLHRRPGDVHVHFLGAVALSFGSGIALENGDVMEVRFDGFGRALRNPLEVETGPQTLIEVQPLA